MPPRSQSARSNSRTRTVREDHPHVRLRPRPPPEGLQPRQNRCPLHRRRPLFLASPFSTPFVPPFFSLRAEVPVAEEFENDDASAFVLRLRDAIPELLWTSAVDGKGKIRIAAETDAQADGPAGLLPTENRSQHTSLSLFRPDPSVPFELWIHISAASDEADRALHALEHRLCLVFRSGSDPDLKRNAPSLRSVRQRTEVRLHLQYN